MKKKKQFLCDHRLHDHRLHNHRLHNHRWRQLAVWVLFVSVLFQSPESQAFFSFSKQSKSFPLKNKIMKPIKTIDTDGNPIVIPQPGMVTVIEFLSPYCAPCSKMTADLDRFWRKNKTQKLRVVGVVLDGNPTQNNRMRKKTRVRFPWIADDERSIADIYQIESLPSVLVIDPSGRAVYFSDGSPGDMERIRRKVKRLLGL